VRCDGRNCRVAISISAGHDVCSSTSGLTRHLAETAVAERNSIFKIPRVGRPGDTKTHMELSCGFVDGTGRLV
jgi:hypothetical protein